MASSRGEHPLPECAPGALPLLTDMTVQLSVQQPVTLPAGWGAPGVLPALRSLLLMVHLAGPLPAEWAAGFRRLEKLHILGSMVNARPSAARRLPEGWAGAFPRLKSLVLADLGISGSLPASWIDPGSRGGDASTAGLTGLEVL